MAIKFGRPIEMRDGPRRETQLSAPPLDLVNRPRRNRKAEWARRLVRENVLTTDDLIDPAMAAEQLFHATALAPHTGATLRRLGDLAPTTLAVMHGSSHQGDGGTQLHALADAYDDLAGAGR